MGACAATGPIVLRISVTDRCQLRCPYCMPPEGVPCGAHEDLLSYEEITALVAALHAARGVDAVRLTGGEPLLRRGIDTLIAQIVGLGIADVALTTNGLRLAELAPALKAAGLRRINISLDALTPAVYARLTGGGSVAAALAGIAAARQAGFAPIKLNTVALADANAEEWPALVDFALDQGCELRFIELMPIGPALSQHPRGFISAAAVRQGLASTHTLTALGRAPGSSAERFAVVDRSGRQGTIGFITSCSSPFCDACRRLRLTADGRLIGCLARNDGLPVRELLRRGDTAGVIRAAAEALIGKRHDDAFTQGRPMAAIGG